ncbi:MAG: serine/threonine protein kinase [Myxococcales bacterium]|nr:serine/threonine protein kinase [Myxococcales bacterium]
MARAQLLDTLVVPFHLTKQKNAIATKLRRSAESCVDLNGIERLAGAIDREILPFLKGACADPSLVEISSSTNDIAEAVDEMTDAEVGNWRIGKRFSQGGYGKVYHCENLLTAERACAKVIPFSEDKRERAEQSQRFRREVRVPADVGHPALIRIHDAYLSEEYQAFAIVMEYVARARHLDVWCRGKSQDISLRIFLDLLDPLAMCHERGLVHRDIKPSNVLLQQDGQLRLLDFGLVAAVGADSATRSNQVLGTLQYISPEQIRDSRRVEPSADVWSVGVMMLEVLTERTVFARVNPAETMNAVEKGEYDLPEGLSESLTEVIRKCLSKEAKDRYSDADELSRALETGLRNPVWKKDVRITSIPARTMAESRIARPDFPYDAQDVPDADAGHPQQRGTVDLQAKMIPDFGVLAYGAIREVCDRCGDTSTSGSKCARCGHHVGVY